MVSLVLLTAVFGLGLMTRLRLEARGWPRFLTAGLHRNLALLTLVFLSLHIITAAIDPFTSLGLSTAVVPFGSSYRTLWLGLGTIAFELLLAVVVTSLVRRAIGLRAWRAVHWLAYACWPLAVVHGLGTGTDASAPWSLGITLACVAAAGSATVWRLAAGNREAPR